MKAETVKFNLGQIVYRKIKPESQVQITGILFRPHGHTYYCTDVDGKELVCYECELTSEKGFVDVQ